MNLILIYSVDMCLHPQIVFEVFFLPVSLYPCTPPVNNWGSYSLHISDRLLITGLCREPASVLQQLNEARTNPYLMSSANAIPYRRRLLALHTFTAARPHGDLAKKQNSGDCFGRLQKTNGLPNSPGENFGFL